MAQHTELALPNDPNKYISSYYELLQVNPIVFDDHLVVILQVPLIDKVYKVYNSPVTLDEYLALSSDGDHATLISG